MPQKGPPWMGWTVGGCNPNYVFLINNYNVFLEKNGHRNQNILLQSNSSFTENGSDIYKCGVVRFTIRLLTADGHI